MENFCKLNLFELSQDEMVNTLGGDKFMKDLGNVIGSALKTVCNFISSSDPYASEVLMNCI